MSKSVLDSIKDDDLIGRAIFSSKYADKKRINARVFIIKSCYISVDRFGFCKDKELTSIQDENAKGRLTKGSKCSFYGWASLNVANARKMDRKVESDALPNNPYHANIILPKDTTKMRDIKRHAIDLAENQSEWKPRYYNKIKTLI